MGPKIRQLKFLRMLTCYACVLGGVTTVILTVLVLNQALLFTAKLSIHKFLQQFPLGMMLRCFNMPR